MMQNDVAFLKQSFEHLQQTDAESPFALLRKEAFQDFDTMGLPTSRHEEWKYTRVSPLFRNAYQVNGNAYKETLSDAEIQQALLPDHDKTYNLFFINGRYAADKSHIPAEAIAIVPLEAAAVSVHYMEIISTHLNHSREYVKDGINALNTAFLKGGVLIYMKPGQKLDRPLHIYHLLDTRQTPVLALPRSLVYLAKGAELNIAEVYKTIGQETSLTNQVAEIVLEEASVMNYWKIQHDVSHAHLINTTHFRQLGKSLLNIVTISLSGGTIRNNLHTVMEASHAESHMYGLYYLKGKTHVDNHTVVDNTVPDCLSNELYKGVLDEESVAAFNGKIFVRKDAQHTNAFQSNKNILLSDDASVNTKPQLEIFADDVKCSHGCTVGCLDEEALFYLQSRGVSREKAVSLLLHSFASDVIEKIADDNLKAYVEQIIEKHLTK